MYGGQIISMYTYTSVLVHPDEKVGDRSMSFLCV